MAGETLLLIDIGAGALPVGAPEPPARPSTWAPKLYTPPPLPAPQRLYATGLQSAVVLTWDPVPLPGVRYVVERSLITSGPWTVVAKDLTVPLLFWPEVTGYSAWYRVRADIAGKQSEPSNLAYATPANNDFSGRVLDLWIGIPGLAIATEDDVILCTEDGAILMTENSDGDMVDVDCRYSRFRLSLIRSITETRFSNLSESHELVIEVRCFGAYTWAMPASIKPVDGKPYIPTPYDGAVDVIRLITMNWGIDWRLIVEKSGFGVAVTPAQAEATVYYTGVANAPSVSVTAAATGANGVVTWRWERADSLGGADFVLTNGTTATPTFSLPVGTAALEAHQLWRVIGTDADGGIGQATVPVTLRRIIGLAINLSNVACFATASPGQLATATGQTTAVASFGTAPYTYAWSYAEHFAGIVMSANGATATFSMTGPGPSYARGTVTVTATDSLGVSKAASAQVEATITGRDRSIWLDDQRYANGVWK